MKRPRKPELTWEPEQDRLKREEKKTLPDRLNRFLNLLDQSLLSQLRWNVKSFTEIHGEKLLAPIMGIILDSECPTCLEDCRTLASFQVRKMLGAVRVTRLHRIIGHIMHGHKGRSTTTQAIDELSPELKKQFEEKLGKIKVEL
jgi:hypothetical protein